jgi:SAM-dependent methyltransferase
MRECSKAVVRRLGEPNFLRRYFVGDGVDIGGRPDPLSMQKSFFPQIRDVRIWDLEDGDAQFMEGVADDTYDFVHSSHCLEHLYDPSVGLANWLRIVRPGGYVVVTVPDEDMYEQGVFPSTFNSDHKWTFTVFKKRSWCPKSINVLDLLAGLGESADVEKIQVLNSTFRYGMPRYDQTMAPNSECAIEFVVRKRTGVELENGGRLPSVDQPPTIDRIYYNQYKNDQASIRRANVNVRPFADESPL